MDFCWVVDGLIWLPNDPNNIVGLLWNDFLIINDYFGIIKLILLDEYLSPCLIISVIDHFKIIRWLF